MSERKHRWAAAVLGLALAATATSTAACTSKDGGDDAKDAKTTSTTASPAVVTKASDAPRTANYVGARKDVTDLACVPDGKVWRVTGKVSNPTESAADYRIFTSFLDGANETRGLVQTDVAALAPHQAKAWKDEVELDAKDLTCVLRVERTGVNGAPPPTVAGG